MQNQWFGARAGSREPGAGPAQKSGSRARRADAVPNRGGGSRLRRDEKLQGGDQSSFLFLHIRTCISRRAALASGRQTRQVGARAGRCHKRGACGRRGGAGGLSARGRAGRGWRGRGAGMTQERGASEAFDGHLVLLPRLAIVVGRAIPNLRPPSSRALLLPPSAPPSRPSASAPLLSLQTRAQSAPWSRGACLC